MTTLTIANEKLVRLRKDRGWSQEKLGAIAGISERTIQRAERDGSCSLETQLALASAFEIPPSALAQNNEVPQCKVEYTFSWGSAVGLLILGLCAALGALLTAKNGMWELASFILVHGVTIALSLTNYGGRATYALFDNTSWLIRHPSYAPNLKTTILHAQSVIVYAYTAGFVSSLATWVALKTHASPAFTNNTDLTLCALRPLYYSILFAELWFRPYKKKIEWMEIKQTSKPTTLN